MTKEEISLAMSYIDDAYINEAYEKKGRSRSFFIKFTALAASLLLVVGLSFPLISLLIMGGVGGDAGMDDSMDHENSQAPDIIYGLGNTAEGVSGKIEYISRKGNEISLRYEKTRAGYTHLYLDCLVNADGEEKRYCATSDAFYDFGADGYDGILLDKIKIYVNGELSNDGYLPTEIGEYYITLDLTELCAIYEIELDDKLLISGFGYFRIK